MDAIFIRHMQLLTGPLEVTHSLNKTIERMCLHEETHSLPRFKRVSLHYLVITEAFAGLPSNESKWLQVREVHGQHWKWLTSSSLIIAASTRTPPPLCWHLLWNGDLYPLVIHPVVWKSLSTFKSVCLKYFLNQYWCFDPFIGRNCGHVSENIVFLDTSDVSQLWNMDVLESDRLLGA